MMILRFPGGSSREKAQSTNSMSPIVLSRTISYIMTSIVRRPYKLDVLSWAHYDVGLVRSGNPLSDHRNIVV